MREAAGPAPMREAAGPAPMREAAGPAPMREAAGPAPMRERPVGPHPGGVGQAPMDRPPSTVTTEPVM